MIANLLAEVAERAYWRGWAEAQRRPVNHGKPGEFFNSLTEEEKEKLSKLTSKDALNIRYDAIKPMLYRL